MLFVVTHLQYPQIVQVRKVEYKDPELEEWEKFKKSMLEVNKVCLVIYVYTHVHTTTYESS